MKLDIVIFGLSITSSWGNGHATTYRGLIRELAHRGHRVLFLERDAEWYAANRDLPDPPFCETVLYRDVAEVKRNFAPRIRNADLVIVGSYVPDGIAVGEWVTRQANGVTAFYDIDTPVTLAHFHNGGAEYLSRALIPRYQLYLSFTGGPLLRRLEDEYGAPVARPLYCAVDTNLYRPHTSAVSWELGYMGTYCPDRQPKLNKLLIAPARRLPKRRFVVAGPLYPNRLRWPVNVRHIEHIGPTEHAAFYAAQSFTLNLTRAAMVAAGYSPSVRLFEAAACSTPIISDNWPGLETFFTPGKEILVARTTADVLRHLQTSTPAQRRAMGQRARERILAQHTPRHRALQLETYYIELADRPALLEAA